VPIVLDFWYLSAFLRSFQTTWCGRRRPYVLHLLFVSSVFISSATLAVHWLELNRTLPHVRKWASFENACPIFGVFPPPKTEGQKTTCFRRFSTTLQLYSNFNREYLVNETWSWQADILTALEPAKGSLHPTFSQNFVNFGSQMAYNRTFVSLIHKCCIPLPFQPSQSEVTESESTKLC